VAWVDELERDLGQGARLRLIAAAGGQRREVPRPASAAGSQLAHEVGPDVAAWLARRFGGTALDIPSPRARDLEEKANHLRAAILEAGLDSPARSANDIAAEFGVTSMWVRKLRARLRAETGETEDPRQLALFRD
jgi:hypothetical protein